MDTLDITDQAAVESAVVEIAPRAVVNCAAFTAVDECEASEELATRINGTAVRHLAAACNRVGAVLVHVSTDYVFSGVSDRAYQEDDPVSPDSAYGRSKLLGEELAREAAERLIVRTAWLYGRGGHNFVEAIRRQIDSGASELRVVADQCGSPTLADDLATAILDLVDVGARGMVHAVNSGMTTWHGFACEIARQLASPVVVRPVSTDEYPRPARRPAYSVLSTSRLEGLIGRAMPRWQDAVARYLEQACTS